MKMFDIGQVVMGARKEEGLSQSQLAERCGLTRSTISLIERKPRLLSGKSCNGNCKNSIK